MHTILIIIYLISKIFGRGFAIVGYDCAKSGNNMTMISLSSLKECPSINDIVLKNKTEIKIKVFQLTETSKIGLRSCLIEVENIVFRCGKSIDTAYDGGFYSEVHDISKEDCDNLHKYGYLNINWMSTGIKLEGLKPNIVNRKSATTHGYIDDGSCEPGTPLIANGKRFNRPVRQSIFKITYQSHEAIIDYNKGVVSLGTGLYCSYSDGSCFTPQYGNSFWSPLIEDQVCEGSLPIKVIYYGDATKTISSVDNIETLMYSYTNQDSDFALMISKTVKYCKYIPVFQTEHPLIFLVETPSHTLLDTIDTNVGPLDIDIMTHINSKLIYMARHNKGQVDLLYSIVTEERCKVEIQVLRQLQTTAYLAPNQFAYNYYGSSGYSAKTAGEVIYITKCQAVSVDYHPISGKCFQEIPVVYQNRTFFIQPRTKLLSLIGTEIDCTPLFRPHFLINDRWMAPTDNSLIITPDPTLLSPSSPREWKYTIPHNLISSGIYPPDVVKAYTKSLYIPDSDKIILLNMAKKSITWKDSGDITVNFVETLSNNEIESLTGKILSRTVLLKSWGFLKDLGSGAAGILLIYACLKFVYSTLVNILKLNNYDGSRFLYLISPLGKLIDLLIYTKQAKETRDKLSENDIRLAHLQSTISQIESNNSNNNMNNLNQNNISNAPNLYRYML